MKNNINRDNIILNNDKIFIENEYINKIEVNGNCEINLFNCNIINLDIDVKKDSNIILIIFV